MWHSFNELKNIRHIASKASIDGNFLDSYAGGWQELFPVYGGPADFCGAEMGIHGEACIYPWDLEVLEDTPECVKVKFSLRTIRSPFLLEKTACIREGESSLEIQQKVTNLGSVSQEFMWGHHLAFGWPFLDENTRFYLNGTPTVTVPNSSIGQNCPFDKETKGQWPTLVGKNGELHHNVPSKVEFITKINWAVVNSNFKIAYLQQPFLLQIPLYYINPIHQITASAVNVTSVSIVIP